MSWFAPSGLASSFSVLAQADESVDELQFLNAPATWVVVLLLIPAVALGVGFIYRREGVSSSGRGKVVLAVLRILAILLVMAALFQPVQRSQVFSVTRSVVAVVVDESASMDRSESYDEDLEDELREAAALDAGERIEEVSRAELIRRAWTKDDGALLTRLQEKVDVEFVGFSNTSRPLADVRELQSSGEATAIGDALLSTLNEYRLQNLSGVILLSDGQSNVGRDPMDVATAAAADGITVHTVGVGNPEPPRNIAILDVEAPDVVLVNDEVAIEVTLTSTGYENDSAELVVQDRASGAELASSTMTLSGRSAEQTETVYFQPDREGEYSLEIRVPVRPGELFEDDNVRIHPLRVEPEVIRVLYVEGRPRWEYRYLKNHLLRADNFKVQCLLVSASGDFIQESSEGVPALKSFPPDRQSLFDYDVIILGDVAPDEIDRDNTRGTTEDLLRELEEFVSLGGGFIMLAGELHAPRDYRDSPIADILPVEIGNPEEEERYKESNAPFRPQLPDPLRPHNIVRLEKDLERNRTLLEDERKGLAPMRWYAAVKRKKRGATVLLEHPTNGNPAEGAHVLAATTLMGDGRTLYIGFDETWLWRKPYGDRYPERFWRSAVRHVAIGKLRRSDKRFDLRTDKEQYNLGESIQISLRVLDSDFRESTDETQVVHTQRDEGAANELTAYKQKDGLYEKSVRADLPGTYRFWVEHASTPDKRLSQRTVEVRIPRLEILDPSLDQPRLEAIANRTGGRYHPLHELDELVETLEGNSHRIPIRTEQKDLWDRWELILAVMALLGVEWALRKKYSLL